MLGAKVNIMGNMVFVFSLLCGFMALQMLPGCSPSDGRIDTEAIVSNDDEQAGSFAVHGELSEEIQILQNNSI